MKIQKAKPKGKMLRFKDMGGGDVFLNGNIFYMKMMFLLECGWWGDYNAIDLNEGEPVFFDEDEEFEMVGYDFIAK